MINEIISKIKNDMVKYKMELKLAQTNLSETKIPAQKKIVNNMIMLLLKFKLKK